NQTLGDADNFGYSVSLDGNRLAVGARLDDGSGNSNTYSGAVYLYTFTDSSFSGAALAATIGYGYSGGKNINQSSLGGSDQFGSSVSLDGNRLAVGAPEGDGTNSSGNEGEVYLYTFSNSTFSGGALAGMIGEGYTGGKNINQTLSSDYFGWALSLDGNRLAVGAYYGDGASNNRDNSGEVYLYTFSNSTFSGGALAGMIGDGYSSGKNINQTLSNHDRFGAALSLDGNRLAVGAPDGDGSGNSSGSSGEVYLYTFTDSAFSGGALAGMIGHGYSGGKNVNQTLGGSDRFGYSVSLNGNRLAVGAPYGDGSGNSLSGSGDVYLYTFTDSAFSGG
ncbi:uncharacterized protein METZ01_LOCUS336941, partial [marine metagenome]